MGVGGRFGAKKRGGGEKRWNGGGAAVLDEGMKGGCCQCAKLGGDESLFIAASTGDG